MIELKAAASSRDSVFSAARLALGGAVLIFCASLAMLPAYDTAGYAAGSVIRPPLLPALLWVFRRLFGPAYGYPFVIAQTAGVLFACGWLAKKLARGQAARLAVFAAAALPLVTEKIGNYVLTECVSYSLLLVSFGLLAELAEGGPSKKLFSLAAIMTLNLLNRPQMIFFYPAYACAVLLRFRAQAGFKRIFSALIFLAAPYLAASAVERTWNFSRSGFFVKSDFAGKTQLASNLIYLSDASELSLFENKSYYPAMVRIYKDMDDYKLFSKYRHDFDMNYAAYLTAGARPVGLYTPYSSRSDIIYWHTLVRELYAWRAGREISREDWKAMRNWDFSHAKIWLCVLKDGEDITSALAPKHKMDYLKLSGSKLLSRLSAYESGALALCLAAPFIAPCGLSIILAMISCSHLANLAVVALTIPIPRLTFYTDTLLLVSLILIAAALVRRDFPRPRIF